MPRRKKLSIPEYAAEILLGKMDFDQVPEEKQHAVQWFISRRAREIEKKVKMEVSLTTFASDVAEENFWKGRVKVGDEFEYLGRRCVVVSLSRQLIGAFSAVHVPSLKYQYADENGVIRESTLPAQITAKLFPEKS